MDRAHRRVSVLGPQPWRTEARGRGRRAGRRESGASVGVTRHCFVLLLYSKTNFSVSITFYGKPVLFSLRNPTPNQPGEQLPQVPVMVLKFCFLHGLSNLALTTKLSGPHTHKRQHLALQELRTNNLNLSSSGQAQAPSPQATHICARQSLPAS